MQIFYVPEISDSVFTLSEDESKHCIRVLRLTKGNTLLAVNGKGTLYTCQIVDPNPKRCIVQIVSSQNDFAKRCFHLHIAIAPTKNIDRFEWFLEKATEIGIDEITPMLCEHSERKVIKTDRLERVIIAAMKQSVKAQKPKLNPLTPFTNLIKESVESNKLIGYCDKTNAAHAKQLIKKGESLLFLIGPEGDFSESEVENATSNGFIPTILGASRLRTETAGVVACSIANLINEQ